MSQKLNERQQQWVDALRSGQYKQTCGYLKTNSGYCCLGVACDIADKAGVKNAWPHNTGTGYLEEDVQKFFNLRKPNPEYRSKAGTRSLEFDNDDGSFRAGGDPPNGKTFSEIADIIEQYASDLFLPDPQNGQGESAKN